MILCKTPFPHLGIMGQKLIFLVRALLKKGKINFPFGKKDKYTVHPTVPKIKKASTESNQGSLIISSGSSKNSIVKRLSALALEAKVKESKEKKYFWIFCFM